MDTAADVNGRDLRTSIINTSAARHIRHRWCGFGQPLHGVRPE